MPLWAYEAALIGGTAIFTALPLALRPFRRASWTAPGPADLHQSEDTEFIPATQQLADLPSSR